MRKNHKGFTLIETLLVALILVLVGLGGYWVWHNQHKNSMKVASSSSPSSTAPTIYKPSGNSVIVKNLGVEFTIPSTLGDLIYSSGSLTDGSPTATFSTSKLEALNGNCNVGAKIATARVGALGTLIKVEGQYPDNPLAGENVEGSLIKQFTSFNIQYRQPQGGDCFTDPSSNNLAVGLRSQLIDAAKTSTEIK